MVKWAAGKVTAEVSKAKSQGLRPNKARDSEKLNHLREEAQASHKAPNWP